MTRTKTLLAGLSLFALAGPAYAQSAPGDETDGEEVVVTGAPQRGAVPGDIKPELQLSPADIRSYGVSSISDLLTELAPQTGSGRGSGQPVVLLNGRRISGFGEIRDIPTEAIERVDILPEEASLKFGYRADQRVVNIVLRQRFRAWTAEAGGGGTTEGGRYTAQADVTRLRISRDRRFNIAFHYDGATNLLENDRDISSTPSIYDLIGNITSPTSGAQIDPAYSALAGQVVTVAGVPGNVTGRPALGSFSANSANVTDLRGYRTLAPATRTLSTNATYSRNILGNVGASINASYQATSSDALQGLPSAAFTLPSTNPYSPFSNTVLVNRYINSAGPLERNATGSTAHAGVSLNGDLLPFRWSFIANYDRVGSDSETDRSLNTTALQGRYTAGDLTANPFGPILNRDLGGFNTDTAHSVTSTGNASMLVNGPLFSLPAGKVNAALRFGFESSDFDSQSLRSGVFNSTALSRDTASGQINVDVPISSKRNGFLAAIGDLSLNGNYAQDHLSDFGTLRKVGYGANWRPIDQIRLIWSTSIDEDAPSVGQLGNPVIVTPNVRVFDFVRGTSVDITQIDGGNAALISDHRRITKFGANVKPLKGQDLTLSADYVTTRISDPIASFPTATAAIEAAFPDRFLRDGAGNLLRIDARPVNFASERTRTLRLGLNFSKKVGPQPQQRFGGMRRSDFQQQQPPAGGDAPPAPPPGEGAPPAPDANATPGSGASASGDSPRGGFGGGPDGGGRGGGGGGRGFGGGGMGGGRLQFAVYDTITFQDEILIRPGLPVLDLLDGAATGNSGGQPRHQVQVQAGITKNGLGARISGNWQSATHVDGGTAGATQDLRFSPLSTLDLRLFAQLSPANTIARRNPWLVGTRFSLSVSNLFDEKLRVTDANGTTPINYQPDLLNPIGRTVKFTIRKLFFSIPAGARPFYNRMMAR